MDRSRFPTLFMVLLLASCSPREAPASPSAPSVAPAQQAPEETWGGLQVVSRGQGDRAVVLLHGFGAQGDDLVPMGEELARQTQMRWLMPAAPLESGHGGGGRAWFMPRAGEETQPQVEAARAMLRELVRTLEREGVAHIAIAGFSQGAMMALDLTLMTDAPITAVGVLSGSPLPWWEGRYSHQAQIFMAHGRSDRVLPFSEAETLRTDLSGSVQWFPFQGGHTIPGEVRSELAEFLTRALPSVR